MTTLAASRTTLSGAPRFDRLRALMGRMADAARAQAARRSMAGLSEHMLRDLGLTRGDIDGL